MGDKSVGAMEQGGALKPGMTPEEFNQLSARLGYPFVWKADAENPGTLDLATGELAIFSVPQDRYITTDAKGAQVEPTDALRSAIRLIQDAKGGNDPGVLTPAQRKLLQQELNGRQLNAQLTHFSAAEYTRDERAMVRHILLAGGYIRKAHLKQRNRGNLAYEQIVYGMGDPLAAELFFNNHGPWCEKVADPQCAALPIPPPPPPRTAGAHLYPSGMTAKQFQALERLPNGRDLMSPFVAVEEEGKRYKAVPFGIHPLLHPSLKSASIELQKAADYAKPRPNGSDQEKKEMAALRDYLLKVADALVSDKPYPFDAADEAWVKIPVTSKWALRIGPDEVYWDVLQQHAGYQIHFGISDPVAQKGAELFYRYGLQKIEAEFADLIGTDVYQARPIAADLPMTFVREVFAEGEARHGHQAVAAFSLPNWGPNAMGAKWMFTNESPATTERQRLIAKTFLGDAYVPYVQPQRATTKTVAHELFHGFGPQDETVVTLADGTKSTVRNALGDIKPIIEETKAETSGYWLVEQFEQAGLISAQERKEITVSGIGWLFSFVSRGLMTPEGKVKTYSGVAAIILGHFIEKGVIKYDEARGQWTVADFDAIPAAAGDLLRTLGRIQATGDQVAAQKLVDHFTKDPGVLNGIRPGQVAAMAEKAGIIPMVPRFQVVIDD
ncbi:MAG: hypothetical protein HYV03_07535 [Deltaproteobacteria bacterium]|nr:hypothetical protein [Deltaproteobacteria bacterium]